MTESMAEPSFYDSQGANKHIEGHIDVVIYNNVIISGGEVDDYLACLSHVGAELTFVM